MNINTLSGLATPSERSAPVSAPPLEDHEPPAPAGAPDRFQGAIDSIIVQQQFPRNTRLHIDEASNRIVAQILGENNEVVRQLPPQELLDISARFNRLEGILFDEQG